MRSPKTDQISIVKTHFAVELERRPHQSGIEGALCKQIEPSSTLRFERPDRVYRDG